MHVGKGTARPVRELISGYLSNQAFEKCSSLVSVDIPESVTRIGHHAFDGCINLTSITIPANLTYIVMNAFDNCNQLKTVRYTGTYDNWLSLDRSGWSDYPLRFGADLYIQGELLRNAVIPEGMGNIGEGYFKPNTPSGKTSIGYAPEAANTAGAYDECIFKFHEPEVYRCERSAYDAQSGHVKDRFIDGKDFDEEDFLFLLNALFPKTSVYVHWTSGTTVSDTYEFHDRIYDKTRLPAADNGSVGALVRRVQTGI